MNIKNKDIIKMYSSLEEIINMNLSLSLDFRWYILKNKQELLEKVNIIMDTIKEHPKFNEFEQKRVELCINYANKDENGNPIIVKNEYDIPSVRRKEFDKLLMELREEYKDAVEMNKKIAEEYKILKERNQNVNIEIVNIKKEDIKDIPLGLLDNISPMLKFK